MSGGGGVGGVDDLHPASAMNAARITMNPPTPLKELPIELRIKKTSSDLFFFVRLGYELNGPGISS
jgi:hypothetical protein